MTRNPLDFTFLLFFLLFSLLFLTLSCPQYVFRLEDTKVFQSTSFSSLLNYFCGSMKLGILSGLPLSLHVLSSQSVNFMEIGFSIYNSNFGLYPLLISLYSIPISNLCHAVFVFFCLQFPSYFTRKKIMVIIIIIN